MAEALKTFREGEDILASETNENNQFLLSKLSDNAAQVQSYVEGEVATIKSNVASVQATLQNNLDQKINIADVSSYVIEEKYESNRWYRIYSNKWCVQGGWKTGSFNQNTKHFLFKPYPNTNYTITPICNLSTALSGKTNDGFYVNGQSGKYAGDTYTRIEWVAQGFIA